MKALEDLRDLRVGEHTRDNWRRMCRHLEQLPKEDLLVGLEYISMWAAPSLGDYSMPFHWEFRPGIFHLLFASRDTQWRRVRSSWATIEAMKTREVFVKGLLSCLKRQHVGRRSPRWFREPRLWNRTTLTPEPACNLAMDVLDQMWGYCLQHGIEGECITMRLDIGAMDSSAPKPDIHESWRYDEAVARSHAIVVKNGILTVGFKPARRRKNPDSGGIVYAYVTTPEGKVHFSPKGEYGRVSPRQKTFSLWSPEDQQDHDEYVEFEARARALGEAICARLLEIQVPETIDQDTLNRVLFQVLRGNPETFDEIRAFVEGLLEGIELPQDLVEDGIAHEMIYHAILGDGDGGARVIGHGVDIQGQ